MNKKAFILVIGISAIVAAACLLPRDAHNFRAIEDVPAPYGDCLKTYLHAMETGPEEAFAYAYFPDDFFADAFRDSNISFLDYRIESHRKINDSLYEFTCAVKSSAQSGCFQEVYYFVGKLADRYVFIGNAKYVPEELSANLDAAEFSYTGEQYL